MDIGIGLPSTIPGVEGKQVVEWARRADSTRFSCLGTLDRLVYAGYDPLPALGAAAAVTERIRLTTDILIVPYRLSAAVLAKQAATVHHLSGGRLELGVAIGAREDDYEAAGVPTKGRGRRFEQMLDEMKRIWAGEKKGFAGAIGPDVSDNPPSILVGGAGDAAARRAAKYGDGWTAGGSPPEQFADGREKALAAWRDAGREGQPKTMALAYFALGSDPEGDARRSIGDYYAWLGDYGDQIVESVAKNEEMVKGYVQAFEQAGCDELILFPSSADPEQVDLLAAAVF
jgi:alkanesulfonate monooxygenase SsuD/methylene tetrahydromethanopterin reductase-like flavin-dependent oxidoreductase (luciferase family)